jgi:hypothetical protein
MKGQKNKILLFLSKKNEKKSFFKERKTNFIRLFWRLCKKSEVL